MAVSSIGFGYDTETNEHLVIIGDQIGDHYLKTDDTYQFSENKEPLPIVYFLQGMIRTPRGKKDERLRELVQQFCAQTEESREMVADCEDRDKRMYLRTEKGYQESMDEIDRQHPEISSAAIMAGISTDEAMAKAFNEPLEKTRAGIKEGRDLFRELLPKFPRDRQGQLILPAAIAMVRDFAAKEKDDKRWQMLQGILRALLNMRNAQLN